MAELDMKPVVAHLEREGYRKKHSGEPDEPWKMSRDERPWYFAADLLDLGWDGKGDFTNPMIYLIWAELAPRPGHHGRVENSLRAVVSNKDVAEKYREAILQESRAGRQVRNVRIEPRDLNHLYGHSMLAAVGD